MKNINDDTKSDSEKFQRVIRKLQEKLDKFFKDEHISRENVFQTNFESAESFKEDSDIKNNQETEQISSKNKQKCKKIRINSLEINILKKLVSEYSVCDKRKYSLTKY